MCWQETICSGRLAARPADRCLGQSTDLDRCWSLSVLFFLTIPVRKGVAPRQLFDQSRAVVHAGKDTQQLVASLTTARQRSRYATANFDGNPHTIAPLAGVPHFDHAGSCGA